MKTRFFKCILSVSLLINVFYLLGCATAPHSGKESKPIEFEIASAISPVSPHLPSGVSQEEVQQKTKEFFHYYIGKYMADVPNVSPRQSFLDWIKHERTNPEVTWVTRNAMTVSEAHGYGMLAIVLGAQMDPSYRDQGREDFDAFVRYFWAYPSPIDNRLMCWRQMGVGINSADGSGDLESIINDPQCSNATDGDMDVAYALLLAHDIWGSDGEINYMDEALRVIDGIRESNVDPNAGILLLGDWAKDNNQILGRTTRSSDFLLGHLRAFAIADEEHAHVWNKVLNETVYIIKYLVANWSEETGLLPDFIVRQSRRRYEPANGKVLESAEDGDYNYNACRVPWRLAADYFSSGDPVILPEMTKMNRWIEKETGGSVSNISPGYHVRSGRAGAPIAGREWSDLAYSSPFMISAAVTDEQQRWLGSLWEYHSEPYDWGSYYGESIQMHSIFVLAGAWRIPGVE